MSDNGTIWAVEVGQHADYRVVGVYSSEAKARVVADDAGGGVAEWPLDPFLDEIHKGLHQYHISVAYDGTVVRCHAAEFWTSPTQTELSVNVYGRRCLPPQADRVWGQVLARDEQHAAKIANEFRARAIARNEMLPAQEDR